MIAAICEKQRVVWGVGRTETDAIIDAHKQASMKLGGIHPGMLRCVQLAADTPMHLDGRGLWDYCDLNDEPNTIQLELL